MFRKVFVRPVLLFPVLLFISTSYLSAATVLVPFKSTWKYLDNGSDQGTAWQSPSFDDSTWSSGPAELGYGDGDEATVVSYGSNANRKYITTYFRLNFNVSDPSVWNSLILKLKRDDGGVVYLNGTEVLRSNMPSGNITYTTLASASSNTTVQANPDPALLVSGSNLLAVEIHQNSASSADLSFDLEVSGVDTPTVSRGPYLTLNTPTGLTVRWRTDFPTSSRVRYGTDAANLSSSVSDSALTTEHSIKLTGLATHITYHYAVGTTSQDLVSGSKYYFRTSVDIHHPVDMRLWVIGNAGTGSSNAKAVRDGYTKFNPSTYTDQWITLGDNALPGGSDSDYQAKFFNIYTNLLAKSVVWPTLGEVDTAGSLNPSSTLPYFNIFDLPANAQSGGVASGTERYYSFTVGTIHFVSLDSQNSDLSSTGPMATWLKSDLAANPEPWLVAFFHHAPYSKGDHDSDTESEMTAMRENILPILEEHEADIVIAAHSHTYERSFFLDGHYGDSTSLTSSMVKDDGDGSLTGDGPYSKHQNTAHEGTAYALVGTSGQTATGPLNHPAIRVALPALGSLVLDLHTNDLTAKFIRTDGTIGDNFTVHKINNPPQITQTSPIDGATYPAGSSITLSATVVDEELRRVRWFDQNGKTLGTDYSAPYSITWKNVPRGTWTITARAEDIMDSARSSVPVTITVQ